MIPEGFEPSTYCLEGSCSIQLSYGTNISFFKKTQKKSGWQDSNLRPPAPKAGAITGLRYTPCIHYLWSDNQATQNLKSGETGTRTLATVTRRQISNLLHYRSGTSPNSSICKRTFSLSGCKCNLSFYNLQLFHFFF